MDRRRLMSLVLFAAGLLAFALVPEAPAQVPNWQGQTVLLKRPNVKFLATPRVGGKVVALPRSMNYKVEGQKGAWIQLRQDGVFGWIQRKDAVRLAEAVPFFTAQIRLAPKTGHLYASRGSAQMLKGNLDLALKDYAIVIKVDPKNPEWVANRALIFWNKKDYGAAIEDYDRALRLNENHLRSLGGLAWSLATCPQAAFRDGKKAVASAKKACELTGYKSGFHMDNLAAAHAEAGNFAEAVKWQKKVLEDSGYRLTYGQEGQERLKLYEAGKPFRNN